MITRGKFLSQLLLLPLTYLGWRYGRSEVQQDNRMYFKQGKRTFVVWPAGNGPLTNAERGRARQMAKDYFKGAQ